MPEAAARKRSTSSAAAAATSDDIEAGLEGAGAERRREWARRAPRRDSSPAPRALGVRRIPASVVAVAGGTRTSAVMIREARRERWRGAIELAAATPAARAELAAREPEGGHRPHCVAHPLGGGPERARRRWERRCRCWASEPRGIARLLYEHACAPESLWAGASAVRGHLTTLATGPSQDAWDAAVVAGGFAHAGVVAALERQVRWGSGWWSARQGGASHLELEEGERERCGAAAAAATALAELWALPPGPMLACGLVELGTIRDHEPELVRAVRRLPGPAGCVVLLDSGLQAARGARQDPEMHLWWERCHELAQSPLRWAHIPGSGLGQLRWRSVLATQPHRGSGLRWDAPGWIVEAPAELVRAVNEGPWSPWATLAPIPRVATHIDLDEVAAIACELVGGEELSLAVQTAVEVLC